MPIQFNQIPHSHPKSQYGASQIRTVVWKRICIFAYMFEKYIWRIERYVYIVLTFCVVKTKYK